jgi:hypothetical protein
MWTNREIFHDFLVERLLPEERIVRQIMNINAVRCKLRKLANKEKAKVHRGFFKNGPGQYGEGDVFLGITVPVLRKLAKECRRASLATLFCC